MAEAPRPPRQPHRGPPRAHQPVHRHLDRDGERGAPALSRPSSRFYAPAFRPGRRPLPGGDGTGPRRRRADRRPRAALQGGRRLRLRAVSGEQARSVVGRRSLATDAGFPLPRPDRQGYSHGTAGRAHLPQQPASATGRGLWRPPRARHSRRPPRPHRGLCATRAGARRIRRSLRGQLLRRRRRSRLGAVDLISCLVLLGAYYARTDGVLMAIASSRLPAGLLTSGLAVLTTVTALGRLLASTAYGALWTWWGAEATLIAFLLGLLAATAGAGFALGRSSQGAGA